MVHENSYRENEITLCGIDHKPTLSDAKRFHTSVSVHPHSVFVVPIEKINDSEKHFA